MNILEFVMGVDSKPFVTGVDRGKAALNEFKHQAVDLGEMTKLGDALKVLGVSFAAFKSIEGIGEGFKSIFEQGKTFRAENKATGESITDLITLQKAYKEVGMDPSGLQQNLTMLQAALGGVNAEGEPTKVIFDQLGISLDRLKSEDAVTQFKEIGTAISSLATQSDKIAAVRAIFGRQGANMINILSDPKAIEEAAKSTAEKAAVYEKNAALFTRVTNEFEAIGMKTQGFFLGAAEGAADALEPILKEIKSIDTIKIGKGFGEEMKAGMEALSEGKLSDLLNPQFDVVSAYGSNALAASVASLPDVFSGVCKKMESMLMDAFHKPIVDLQAIIDSSVQNMLAKHDDGTGFSKFMNYGGAAASGLITGGVGGMVSAVGEQAVSGQSSSREWLKSVFGYGGFDEAESFPSTLTRHENTGPVAGLDGSGYTSKEISEGGSKDMQSGAKLWSDTIKGSSDYAVNSAKQIQALIAKADAARTDFSNKFASHHSAEEEDRASSLKKFSLAGVNVKGDSFAHHGTHEQAGDRLAKIGGLIGGGGPAAEHARRTADATVDLRNLLKAAIQSGIKVLSPPGNTSGGDAIAT